MVEGLAADPLRKRTRVGHRSERAGINAVRTVLERNGLVVDEVNGRSDYGRDLNVDIVCDGGVTGGIIGVQVKSGPSYFRNGRWVIPASPVEWEYWRSSTVPVIGMVYDPVTETIRWRNLSHLARSRVLVADNTYTAERQSDDTASVDVTEVLNDELFDHFIDRVTGYLAATSDAAYLFLVDLDDEVRRQGVFNCWTLGRHDPRPLLLLRRLLPSLRQRSLIDGVSVLAHATAHPDIFWTPRNWISPPVEDEVRASFRWSVDEVVELIHQIETMDDGGADWQRGGVGQSLWSILVVDPALCNKLPSAIRAAMEAARTRAAVRLLICFQYLTESPEQDVDELIAATPGLRDVEDVGWVVEHLRKWGRFDVY
ncbi:hypothetical protein FHT40_002448 [Mycolicibacterium sp. BK556]|uniref:DUF4365 domain-containing protein n=1 Tax=unclassified Mycolicibacterium TaxID=2636767 RepID=UPI0016075859|nr:hypothetical protein [Mycolicibacterium sp. BK556]MBB3632982.1 hypothetical protein [Mycolicibacterium sp. BK607]